MTSTVLITGASRGLGLGLVKAFIERGSYKVLATCRSPANATELAKVLAESNQPAAIACDIAEDESIAKCVGSLKELDQIDILINNAGISNDDHPNEPPSKVKREEFLRIMNTNVAGVLAMTSACLPLLKHDAKVISISSSLGSVTLAENFNCTSYRCSKAAVNMAVKTLALEKPDMTFLAIHPGWVATDMGSAKNRSPPLTIPQSCGAMYEVIANLKHENSGEFRDYNGKVMPY